MSDIEEVRGKRALIQFEAKKCIHSRHCVLDRPDVFVPNVAGEWIHPDNATPEEIAALAENCPSGAIRYERLDGGPGEKPPLVNLARVRENGPLAVHAELNLEGHGALFRATLCRCGLSKNKPFCDSSHTAGGFSATGEPATLPSEALSARSGTLKITPAKNGPLLVAGNLELVSGTGRTLNRVTKTALCRCGQSANKPYCDGTHAKVGFSSE
ncbi:MAG: CDGSH iron-sulfur domain-containing protein [Polyangiaceae bacterium]|nr:CDGSH iron-sulfur domain-containing protein [Polyangiaceae bacterium]